MVGIPARCARSRPGFAFRPRFARTWHIRAFIRGGVDVVASMRACKFVPVPDIKTSI